MRAGSLPNRPFGTLESGGSLHNRPIGGSGHEGKIMGQVEVDEITEIEHKLIAATTAQGFMDYMDDDHIRYDFAAPLRLVGEAQVRANFEHFFKVKDIDGKFLDLQVVADRTVGVAHSVMYFTWTGEDAAHNAASFRVTHGFHKVNDEWTMFHTHVSFPIDEETGQAQMNLEF